jgi:hypothetical protein
MNLVTVYRSFSIAEAQVVRSRLEAAQMQPEIANEIAAVSIDGYTQAAGGVLVQVPESHAEAARQLLADIDAHPA